VVPRFLKSILSGGSVVVFEDGKQTRDFVYVSDVVQALVSAATANSINRMVINVGSGQETSVRELVSLAETATGKQANVISNGEKSGGVQRLVADISRAQQLLGFRPQVSLAKGLSRVLKEDHRFQGQK
jgi:UDP-glucose 4-epimerase